MSISDRIGAAPAVKPGATATPPLPDGAAPAAGYALRFDHVTKTFTHHTGQLLLRDRLWRMLRPSQRGRRLVALNDISFELGHGDSLALIGHNGAGKSTCLSLATGLSLPDSGRIEVRGRVAAILELGGGFHHDLTGAENLRINAALMGLTRRQTAERYETIIDFSGIRESIDDPLRTYSAGMIMRLAFSVAVHTDPDILLLDEVIGLGYQYFFERCLEKIRDFQRQGKTIVLASHSLELLQMFCQRAMWLDHGHVMMHGPAAEVVEAYRARPAPAAR